MKRQTLLRIGVALVVAVAAIAIARNMNPPAQAASDLKGVICHATGSEKNPYNGIIVGLGTNPDGTPDGTFSNNGHIDESGNVLSGHEHDIFLGSAPPNTKSDCDKLPPPPK